MFGLLLPTCQTELSSVWLPFKRSQLHFCWFGDVFQISLVIRPEHPHIILHIIYIYIHMRISSYTDTCTHPHIHTCIHAHYCIDACMHAYSLMYVHMRSHGPQPQGLDVAMRKNVPLIDELPMFTSEHYDFIRWTASHVLRDLLQCLRRYYPIYIYIYMCMCIYIYIICMPCFIQTELHPGRISWSNHTECDSAQRCWEKHTQTGATNEFQVGLFCSNLSLRSQSGEQPL